MKKLATFILAFVCAVGCTFAFTACGDSGNTGNSGGNEQPQTVAVTSVTLNKTALTLDIGGTETLTATVKPDNATNKTVTWQSDKPEIASVVSGKVTAVAEGTATITATADGKSATCSVTVNKATDTPPDDTVAVTSVTLSKTTLTLDIGGTETLTATVKPDNATNKTVTWQSDKPEIASVVNGKVTAVAEGTATITATADGKSDTCTVTVNKATENPPADTNKYAEIITALQEKVSDIYTNPKVLTIYEYDNTLACKIKDANAVYSVTTKILTVEHSLTSDIIDTSYYVTEIQSASRLAKLSQDNIGIYSSDGTAEEKQLVESIITKILGDGYTVMYGTISAASNKGVDPALGDSAAFNVYALLEKDGRVYEYSETITVSKGYGDVYQTVLNSTEANKDNIYKCNNNTPVDLGDVAALYWAECNK